MFYNQDDIRDHIASFYERLYTETDHSRPLLEEIQFSAISDEDAMWLERTFDENEIVDVVKGFNEDKLRGQMVSLWPFFSSVGALFEVRWWLCVRNSHFKRSLNATFVTLIPKKHGADEIKNFRPISLVGGMYKIIAKMLVIRLSVVLGKIISPSQNAFVKGRQILDFVLIAN